MHADLQVKRKPAGWLCQLLAMSRYNIVLNYYRLTARGDLHLQATSARNAPKLSRISIELASLHQRVVAIILDANGTKCQVLIAHYCLQSQTRHSLI